MLKNISTILCFVMMMSLCASCAAEGNDMKSKESKKSGKKSKKEEIAVIKTEKGTMKVEFYPDDAPGHVKNFKKLVKKGFYDGLIFHRVIANFMIQGGCPDGTGRGGPGYSIKAEFNDRKHVEGTLAMARSQDPDSAGSQFYICHGSVPHLDGKYTVFGQVFEGLEVIHKIERGDKIIKITIQSR